MFRTPGSRAIKRNVAAPTRRILTAATTLYVRPNGNNSNSGLRNTSDGALLSYDKAFSLLANNLDIGSQNVTITNGAGATFTAALNVLPWIGGGQVTLDLNGGAINSTSVACLVANALPGVLVIQNGTLQCSVASALSISASALITIGSCMVFGPVGAGGYHMQATSPGAVINKVSVNYTVTGGNCAGHVQAADGGQISGGLGTVTISSGLTVATAFAFGVRQGLIIDQLSSFTNSSLVTGSKYSVITNSVIDTGGGSSTYFPGSLTGTSSSGGTYI